jgi:hypothetical protein
MGARNVAESAADLDPQHIEAAKLKNGAAMRIAGYGMRQSLDHVLNLREMPASRDPRVSGGGEI